MPQSPFNKNHEPTYGEPVALAPGLAVLTAPNAGPMTFTGTQTYILGEGDLAIIDPGPDLPEHREAIIRAVRGRQVSAVLVTHSHVDHSGLAGSVARHFDAPVYGFGDRFAGRSAAMDALELGLGLEGGEGVHQGFVPDIHLSDNEIVEGKSWSLRALHSPGHMSNHLCFEWREERVVFSGDHLMAWATTLVSPPDGEIGQFMASLEKIKFWQSHQFLPGHGPEIKDPGEMINHQIGHRKQRERQILEVLSAGPSTIPEIVGRLYAEVPASLHPAAARNVFAHLVDLRLRAVVLGDPTITPQAEFRLKE